MARPPYYDASTARFAAGFKPPDKRPPWAWCEDNVIVDETSPYQGHWKLRNTPWVKEPMEAWQQNWVRDIVLMTSAQGAKTQTGICLSAWSIGEDPAPMMWVTANDDEAKFQLSTRIRPTYEKCQPVARIMKGIADKEVKIPGAPMYVTGAQSKAARQSKPVRWLLMDEVRSYPPGAYEMLRKRTRAWWNSTILTASTPDKDKDALHRAYLSGDQNVWHVPCPACGKFFALLWDTIIWDNKIAGTGRIDFDALAETIRCRCPHCKEEHPDTGTVRQRFARHGKFVPMNPTAPKSRRSFHWNALLPPWLPWRELVEEFLIATATAKLGDVEPLKDFINESLGQPWEDRLGAVAEDEMIKERLRAYTMGEDWPGGAYRIIAADKQAKGGSHYWWVVREFAKHGGESRLVAYGRANTDEELVEAAEKHNVHKSRRIVDCGYDWAEVLKFCHFHGWKPFRGDSRRHFTVKRKGEARPTRQTWMTSKEPVNFGTRGRNDKINVYRWSNPSFKDMQAELSQGLVGNWTLPRNPGKEYLSQYTAEIRVEKETPRGEIVTEWKKIRRDDHLKDCELMITVCAVIMKILSSPAPDEEEPEEPQGEE